MTFPLLSETKVFNQYIECTGRREGKRMVGVGSTMRRGTGRCKKRREENTLRGVKKILTKDVVL